MKKLKNWLIDYFNISQTEANGFLVLSFILMLTVVLPLFVRWQYDTIHPTPIEDKIYLDSLIVQLAQKRDSILATQKPNQKKSSHDAFRETTELFSFNPNEIEKDTWKKLGVPDFLIQRILKYREKGGKFIVKADLRKIYDFPADLYEKLEPYITLPEKLSTKDSSQLANKIPSAKKNTSTEKIDLNEADTLQWKRIKGIGSVLAKRIVAYREKLGGFYSIEQLSEVYGLSEEVIDEIRKVGQLSNPLLQKININQATAEELAKHPYLSFSAAKAIVNYRHQHGNFASPDDLKRLKALEEKTLQKILPYLSFE